MIHVEFDIAVATLRLVGYAALIALLSLWLAVLVRRRRRREREARLRLVIPREPRLPLPEHPAILEFRREVDLSHQRYLRSQAEEEWRRDGGILLEKRTT